MIAVGRLARLGERLRSTVRPRSIRTRLVALLLTLALAPLALSGFLAGHYGRTSLQESIGSNLQKVARAVVSSVDQGIEQRRRNVQALAAFPVVRESSAAGSKALVAARRGGIEEAERAYANLSWEAHPVARHPLSHLLVELLSSSYDMSQIFLTDRDGWVIAASSRTEDFYQADETWWFRAVSGGCGRSYVDDLRHDTSVGDQAAAITVPVCVDGEVAGVLKGKVALNRILHLVSELDLEGSARVWIIKNNGEAVAAVEGSRLARVETGGSRPAVNVARRIVGSVSGYLEARMAEAESVIGYASSTGSGEFQGLGWIVLVVEPVAGAYAPIARFHATIAVVSAVMLLVVLALGIRAAARMAEPIRRSTAAALAIAQGDLTQRIQGTGPAELDLLADRFNGMTGNLRRMVGSIRQAAGEVESVSQLVADGSGVVLVGSRDQITQVEETTELMNEADSSLEDVSQSLSQMVSATDDCSSSILEMEASITEIVCSTEALAGSTDSTLAAVEEMVQSITQVDRGIESLRSLATATDASVSGMEGVVQRVENMAGRTAESTDRAAAAAEAGRVAVERTVAGMGGIEQSANQASKVIRKLTEDVGRIGGILEIIQEVTDQTNLLALNASILAAQAGDHGRGFAVVATEIKDLAERTARSTNEITDLIRSIQNGASEAGQAMANGIRHINDGVARSLEAGDALQKIQGGTQESSEMTREIVGAATEHAAQSRQMTSAVKRINETVTRLAATTQEQARGCTSILQASEQMRDLTALVRKAILDQKQGSRRISGSVEQINVMARAIDDSGQRQKGLSKSVVIAMGRIGSLSHANVASLAEMDNAVRTLTQRAEELRGQISRFRGGS